MREWLFEHFGYWIWYDSNHIRCEYEQMKYSVYSLNFLMILVLIIVLLLGLRHKQVRRGLSPEARWITGALFLGLCGWAWQYVLNLHTFQPGLGCYFPKDLSRYPVAKYGGPMFSSAVSLAFLCAGSYLLQLKGRFHAALGAPTSAGIQLKTLSRILGSRSARVSFVLIELIIMWFQWRGPDTRLAIWADSLGNCASHVVFGLGLLRELNRERVEFSGMILAMSMLFYGAVQLTSLKDDLFFWGYILAAFLKFALMLTMRSFGGLVHQSFLVRRETQSDQRREFADVLLSLGWALRHELSRPLAALDLRVAQVALRVPESKTDLNEALANTRKSVEAFFDRWPGRLRSKPIDLKETLSELGLAARLSTNGPYEVVAPTFLLICAINRLRENALKSGAREIQVELGQDRHSVWLRIANDGPPIPPEAKLFEKPHGTWVAKQLVQLVDGNLQLESNGPNGAVFRVDLPHASKPARPEVQGYDMALGVSL
ncbi:MAG TPA: ATP-binding protein [Candidatus Angelobacter sp.]